MAKRFIDSSLFRKPLVRALDAPSKLLWIYIQCECDHAGIWIPEMDIVNARLGVRMTEDKALEKLAGLVQKLPTGEWFIGDFVPFQYGKLNPLNRAHSSVIDVLKAHGLMTEELEIKGLTSPLEGAKDKEKDMDKEKEGVQGERPRPLDKKEVLRKMCAEVIAKDPERLPEEQRAPFFDYWIEPNAKGKLRWEDEEFFEVGRRMDTWMKRSEAFSGK